MKKVSFIAAFAFAAFISNSANAATFTTENAETITTRTETPVKIMGEDMLKITITIHFKKWDLTIEIECITVGGGNSGGGTTEVDGTLEGNMLKIQLPEGKKRDLAGASQFRVAKGGTFKLPNGEMITIKNGQILTTTDLKTLTCPVSVSKQTQGATFGEKVNAGRGNN